MSRHCTNCGAAVTNEWKHCSHCGSATEAEAIRQESKSVGAGIREGWQSAAPYSKAEIETQREMIRLAESKLSAQMESLHTNIPSVGLAASTAIALAIGVPCFIFSALRENALMSSLIALVFLVVASIVIQGIEQASLLEERKASIYLGTGDHRNRVEAESATLVKMQEKVDAYERAQARDPS
jgi:hypothetical protein